MPVPAALGLLLACAPFLALALLGAHGLWPLLADPAWHAATLRTLRLAALATPPAVALGTTAALLLRKVPRPANPAYCPLLAMPFLLPLAWMLPRLQAWTDGASPHARLLALLAIHVLPAASLACLPIMAGLARIQTSLPETVATAGGTEWTAWRLVVLPDFLWALFGACATAFAAAMGLSMADRATLGAMLTMAVQTADVQVAPAGLLLALLAAAPLAVYLAVADWRGSGSFLKKRTKKL